jgi:osmotically inducible protein OsmC
LLYDEIEFCDRRKGFTVECIQSNFEITYNMSGISASHLTVKANVPGLSEQEFQEAVKDAEENCPVPKMLNITISSDAKLIE